MFIMPVNDMPKMKEFYAQQMGFQITKEYRQEDARWWTSIKLDDDKIVITLSTFYGTAKPGTMTLYLFAPDIEAAHKDLTAKGIQASPITPDLYGPGSGVKWFSVKDPEGNTWTIGEKEPQ